jgi:hypothetical protein
MYAFRKKANVYGQEFLAPRPTPKLNAHLLSSVGEMFVQYICSYPTYWRPFLHPQPEDVPCRGEPIIMDVLLLLIKIIMVETTFHTHFKQQAESVFVDFNLHVFR